MIHKKARVAAVIVWLAVSFLLVPGTVILLGKFSGQRQIEKIDVDFVTIKADPGFVYSVTFHPNGKEIMTVGESGRIRIWDVASRKIKKEIAPTKSKYVEAVYSHDGKLIAATSKDRHLHFLVAKTGQELVSFDGYQMSWPTFSPDDRIVAFANAKSEVELYDISKRRVIGRLTGHSEGAITIRFSPNGTLLATGAVDDMIRIWDVKLRKTVAVLPFDGPLFHMFPPCLAFSPDGGTLVSGHYDAAIRLWNVKSGRQDGVLYGHKQRVSALAFRPDGKVFASAGSTEIMLWHLETGQRRLTLKKHESGITGLSFDSTGRLLASVSADSNLIVWDLWTG